ncbi:probable F-box protein At1g44080 [Panicum virgatum]|uniref:probable F-box protein At1g44080 n=1 Tax=Panicum virgatum TaxID=38727 RepID=UPI0019D604D0|nr:probable F-box protein At1g44080 [Panicum virgatum]
MDWPSPWSELPADLVGLILRVLPCHIDRLRFRSVCRQWRLAERQQRRHLPPALPLICLGRHDFLSPAGGELRRFRTDDVDVLRPVSSLCHASFGSWLVYQRYGEDSKCFLINPLSGATIEMPLRLDDGARINIFSARKIIVCSPDLVAAILWGSTVAFCRPGAPSWSACRPSGNCYGRRREYVDIALHRGKLYALNNDGSSSFMRSAASSSNAADQAVLKVFEADLEGGRWTEVNSLDNGEALFVGRGCSKAVRLTGSDRRFQENCVYILGNDFFGYCYDYEDTPSYASYDLRSSAISHVVLDIMRVVWPVLSMEWFFPQEQV